MKFILTRVRVLHRGRDTVALPPVVKGWGLGSDPTRNAGGVLHFGTKLTTTELFLFSLRSAGYRRKCLRGANHNISCPQR